MAQVWIDDVYTDFSNSANRAKFAASGVPVDLGATGSTPFRHGAGCILKICLRIARG